MNNRFRFIFLFIALLAAITVAYGQKRMNIDSLESLFNSSSVDSVKIRVAVEISSSLSNNQPEKALTYSDLALKIAEKTKDRKQILKASHNAGIVCFEAGLLENSANHFFRCLELAREEEDTQEIVTALVNISAVKYAANQHDSLEQPLNSALQYLSKQYGEKSDTTIARGLAGVYNNLGVIALEQNDNQKAVIYFNEGLKLMESLRNNAYSMASLLNNLGKAYTNLEQYEDAFQSIQKALKIREDVRDINGLASSYRNLAFYYEHQGKTSEALANYRNALQLARETGNNSLLEGIYKGMFNNYYEKGNSDSALKYYILFKEQSELISREEASHAIARRELTYQFEQRQKLQLEEQRRKELRYLYLSIVMVLAAVIAGLLYFLTQSRLRRSLLEKSNAELVNNNLQLSQDRLKSELELKNKELATAVMYQIQRNELMNSITQRLLEASPTFSDQNKKLIREIVHDLDTTRDNRVWDEFEIRFQQVHNDFYDKLQQICSNLTTNERRLCAFLRLNMTTKDIGAITGQSIRSIEVARTRLRKKLEISNQDISLVEFLNNL